MLSFVFWCFFLIVERGVVALVPLMNLTFPGFHYFLLQTLELTNISKQELVWKFDLDAAGKAVDDGAFKFSLYTGVLHPGQYTVVTVWFCPCKYFFGGGEGWGICLLYIYV